MSAFFYAICVVVALCSGIMYSFCVEGQFFLAKWGGVGAVVVYVKSRYGGVWLCRGRRDYA